MTILFSTQIAGVKVHNASLMVFNYYQNSYGWAANVTQTFCQKCRKYFVETGSYSKYHEHDPSLISLQLQSPGTVYTWTVASLFRLRRNGKKTVGIRLKMTQ